MLCFTQKWVTHSCVQFWVFTFWNLSPESKCFFCISVSFISTADKFVTNG